MTRAETPLDWLAGAPSFPTPDGIPVHAGIARWLTDLIGRGDLVPGDRLPREDVFAASLGVSRMTLRQALATLEGKGTLERKTGRLGGTFVREPRIECDLTGMAGFTEQMRRANLRAGARVVSAATVPANAKAASRAGRPARHPRPRDRPGADRPARAPGHRAVVLPHRAVPGPARPRAVRLAVRPHDRAPTACAPPRPSSRWSRSSPGPTRPSCCGSTRARPSMLITRTAFTTAGLAVEFARDIFRPDRIKIALRTGIA